MAALQVRGPGKRLPTLPVVYVIDGNQIVREEIVSKIWNAFAERCEVASLNGEQEQREESVKFLQTLSDGAKMRVAAVVVAWELEFAEGTEKGTGVLAALREALGPATEIILYADEGRADAAKTIVQRGVTVCRSGESVLPAIGQAFRFWERKCLAQLLPTAAEAFDAIGVGVSIESPRMEVLWASRTTKEEAHTPNIVGQRCWEGYHSFKHRRWPCTKCTAWKIKMAAKKTRQTGDEKTGPPAAKSLTGYHLLPVRDKHGRLRITRVEVNAAPYVCGESGELLAIIEATRFATTKQWGKKPAHVRVHEVIETAQQLGRERRKSQPFAFVAVYHGAPIADSGGNLFLFDFVIAKDAPPPPKVLRSSQVPEAYRQAIARGGMSFVRSEDSPDGRRHFLLLKHAQGNQVPVFLDVAYVDDKPEGLFTHDLAPYWEYVEEHFSEAAHDRKRAVEHETQAALQRFLADTAIGIGDEEHLRKVLDSVAECVGTALHPLSMHVRIYNRETNGLDMRKGFGKYFELAPKSRPLAYDGVGSAWAASHRQELWEANACLEKILNSLDTPPSAEDRQALQRIVSYVTLPLLYAERVLGTLNIQFEDDSLLCDVKCDFLTTLAKALAGVLAGWEWSNERRAIIALWRDLDAAMFQKSTRPLEEQEEEILEKVSRLVSTLTSAELVLYYRLDTESGKLLLVPAATRGPIPPGTKPPAQISGKAGVIGSVAATKEGKSARDYKADRWKCLRSELLNQFRYGPERKFCEGIACVEAQPVVVDNRVRGVFLALSSIPEWLGQHDTEVVSAFAFKTGLAIEARQLIGRLTWELLATKTINDIRAAMAWSRNADELRRLFLLAVTAGECLGFSRAILFLRGETENADDALMAVLAVGPTDRDTANRRWKLMKGMTLDEMIAACAEPAPAPHPGDLQALIGDLRLDLNQHPEVAEKLRKGLFVLRRHGQPHFIKSPELLAILTPADDHDAECVLAPLKADGQIIGAVLADRAFLPGDTDENALNLLGMLSGEFGQTVAALAVRRRRKEEEDRIARDLAWGIGYSLRTQASVLENRLANLEAALGQTQKDQIAKMRKTINFFLRAGTLAVRYPRFEEVGIGDRKPLDLNVVLSGIIDVLNGGQIRLGRAPEPVTVDANSDYLRDVFVEILANAQDFVDKRTGVIEILVSTEDRMARVDVVDNGPGIHPDVRAKLFQRFTCFPASRMGLGLAYANSVVAAHGGTIEEIGEWRHGAHFVVRIPLSKEQ